MYLPVLDNVRLSEQNVMTNHVVTNLQATGVANELSNYSSLVGRAYPPTSREQFLLGAEGMAQQATINSVCTTIHQGCQALGRRSNLPVFSRNDYTL